MWEFIYLQIFKYIYNNFYILSFVTYINMESKKVTSFLLRIISFISIFMLVLWNNFFVFADQISNEKVSMKWEAEIISTSSWWFTDVINEEEAILLDYEHEHGHEHEHEHEDEHNHWEFDMSSDKLVVDPLQSEEIEIEWILEQIIGEWPNGYMEEMYLLYDESYWRAFMVNLNNIIDDSYVWSRVVLWWLNSGNIFITNSLLSNQAVLQSQVATTEFTPESKNTRNVAIFMVKVNGNNTIWSEETAESKIFWETNSAKEYFDEISYWELEINTDADQNWKNDIFWPFEVDGAWKCEYSTWRSQSVQQAKDLWIDTSKYHNIILILPSYSKIGCSWAGLWNVWSVDSNFTMYSWIAYSSNSVVQHELWHNFGMWHASTDTDNNGSVNSEYWDQSWVMWGPAWMPLKIWVNAPHMDQLNWWDHVDWYYEFANESVNNYILQPLQLDPNTVEWTRVVKFPKKNNNEYYYVSYRQPVGYNAQMYSKYQPWLTIHTYRGSWYSNTKLVKKLNNWEEFFDATNNIRITSQWIDEESGWMKVLVETNPWACVKGNMNFFKLPWNDVFKSNTEWNIDVRLINNDVDCDEQKILINSNQETQLNWTLTSTWLSVHPNDFKDTSFVFNSWNTDWEFEYSISAIDNDWITPDHGTITITGSIIVDWTAPSQINNLSYNKQWSLYNFTWTKSLDNLSWVDKYEVYRDTGSGYVLHRNIYPEWNWNIINFSDSDLWAFKYSYKVIAVDNAENKSIDSNIVTIDNSKWVCIFNGWEIILNSRFISTSTWSIHNLPYTLTNKNINCNQTVFNLSVWNTEGFNSILDKNSITLASGESSTWVLQVQTSNIPGEYQIIFSNTSNDYTQWNKLLKIDTVINFSLEWEFISAPNSLEVTKNLSNYNFTWNKSTYISIWWEEWWGSSEWNNKENNVIYEVYRSNSSDFNNYELVYTWSINSFTDRLNIENQYKYYVIWTNGKWLVSDKSNIIDVDYILPVNINGTLLFNSWSFVNNRMTQIEINASAFPVDYVITWDITKTWSISSQSTVDLELSNGDWLKTLNIQYFWNNWKSNLITNSTTLDTTNPVLNLITNISWSGMTQSNILLEWTLIDTNWIKTFKINWIDVGINNWNWNNNVSLNIGINNINYLAIDNAGNTLTWVFVINRVIVPEVEDSTPDDINFSIRNNAQLNLEYTSNRVTITWINTWAIVSIDNGLYSINQSDFVSSTGVIFNNNTIELKGVSSSEYNKSITVNITVWWVSKGYIITTKSQSRWGGWGWGWWKRKPKILCTIEEHLVCEQNRKWVYKYYKKQWVTCLSGDLWKICNESEHEQDENDKEYSDLKKLLLSDKSDLLNNNIDDILSKIPDVNLDEDFEHKWVNDYNDTQIKKIFLINNDRFNKLNTKLNDIEYLSENYKKYLYYLDINNLELNNILSLLEVAKINKNKLDILKYYNEYKVIKNNIKSVNNILWNIWKIKYKDIWNDKTIAYFQYKNKIIRKKQTILSIKMKRKEFNQDLFYDINMYLHNEHENIINWRETYEVIYKLLLDRIKNL